MIFQEVFDAPFKLVPSIIFSILYSLGGRGHKWIRRFLSGTVFSVLIFIMSGNTFLLAIALILPFSLSFGYGADDWELDKKIQRRALYGFLLGITGVYAGYMTGQHILGILQLIICIISNVILGVFNPVEASKEEMLIAFLSVFLVPFMIS